MTVDDYKRAWERERDQTYPVIDALELACGYAVPRGKLEGAARTLACPVKANPPNWQHGRVIYALSRKYLKAQTGPVSVLDIGTAKGFSALCFLWSLGDAGVAGRIVSVDVLDPNAKVKRNTVLELDGFRTLYQTIFPWIEPGQIDFRKQTGVEALSGSLDRIHLAFIDGKHTFAAVLDETRLLAKRQHPGDLAIFDDAQIEGVDQAVLASGTLYDFQYLQPLPHRRYAIGTRRE
jgi:hypothetical protein